MSAERFNRIVQVGLIALDKEKVISSMREVFKVEPDVVRKTLQDNSRIFRGKPGTFLAECISYKFANIDIEFVIPIEGPSVWQEWIGEHGIGLHHLLFDVDSWDGAVNELEEAGIPLAQGSASVTGIPGVKTGYFDSFDKLLFVMEMRNTREMQK